MIELQPGGRIDRYEIVGVVGQGGMAAVLEVRHLELGTRHALKILQMSWPGLHERLLMEGRIQARMAHPNVCRVSDVVRVDGVPGLVMDLVAGPALDQLLAHFQPNLLQIDALAVGIVSGVRAAHEAGLVHRDLKPANVLLDVVDGVVTPKVADFGLARAMDDTLAHRGGPDTRSGLNMGTPGYMAPEQFRDAKRADQRSDLFSLGCILYELATGMPAFSGESAIELYEKTSKGAWRSVREIAPHVPERIERAIARTLAPDPADRWASCAELLEAWTHGAPVADAAQAFEPSHVELVLSLGRVSRAGAGSVSVTGAAVPPTLMPVTGPAATAPTPAPPALATGPSWMAGAVGVGLVGLVLVACGLAIGVGVLGAWWLTSGSEVANPVEAHADPAPAPEPAPVPVARPSPVAPATVAPVPAPSPKPSPPPIAAPRPRPAPPPPAPAPAPAASPHAKVTVEGVDRAFLVAPDGTRARPGDVAPGAWALQVFFEEGRATRVLDLTLSAGDEVTVRCDATLKVCR